MATPITSWSWRARVALLLLVLLVLLGAGALVFETWWDDFSSWTHYEALGVAATAPLRDIKRAFRERSLQYHPDKSTAGSSAKLSTQRFHRISDAYQVLSDDQARAVYDQELLERARRQAMQYQSWRTKLTPAVRDWPSMLRFYVTEFPFAFASIALHAMDVRLFMMALVCAGCAIFAVDLVVRIVRALSDAVFASSPQASAARRANDAAMRAARARQQQALDAPRAAHAAALTRRHVQPSSRAAALT